MQVTTEVFGIESKDLDAVTEEVAKALGTKADLRYGEPRGGDYTAFDPETGGSVSLQKNYNGIEQEWEEKDYKEFGLIIIIEQEENYFDYEPKLAGMKRFPATLLYRNHYDHETGVDKDLFVLKEARAKAQDSGPA